MTNGTLEWQTTGKDHTAKTDTGEYLVREYEDKAGCAHNGNLCGLFGSGEEAKEYAARLHRQLSGNPWLTKRLNEGTV